MEEKKEIISEKINEFPIESSQITKKPKKKIKKKEKKNFKDLRDLLDNIKENNKDFTDKLKIKNTKKTRTANIENEKAEINDNKNIDSEKEKKNVEIGEIKCNNDAKYISTLSFSNSNEYNTNDTQNDKIELFNKENKEEIPKIKIQNYILKNIEINNNINNNILNNIGEEKSNNSKFVSYIWEYYEESEKKLKKMFSNKQDYKNSINYVEKDIIASNEFNFNNDKFIKINILNKMMHEHFSTYNNSHYFDINKFVNLNLNNTDNSKYNYVINNCLNSKYYPNSNLNINLFCNNIYFNGSESNNINNINNKFNESQKNKFGKKDDSNSNSFSKLNNFILQNAFSFEENSNNIKKKNYQKILEKLNLIFNSNNNLQKYNPIIFNFTQHNNNYNFNNIYNDYSSNEFKKTESNKNNKNVYINENNVKKNKFCLRPNDWLCSKCYNLNFGFRIYCNRCSASKEFILNTNNNH